VGDQPSRVHGKQGTTLHNTHSLQSALLLLTASSASEIYACSALTETLRRSWQVKVKLTPSSLLSCSWNAECSEGENCYKPSLGAISTYF